MYTYDYRPSTPLGALSTSKGNRLIKVRRKTTGEYSPVVEYVYDGLNRRVKKDKSGLADGVVYLYDGWRACPP